MANLVGRGIRVAGLAAAALLLPACFEADTQAALREDGSGTLAVSVKFTEKFVEASRKLQKVGTGETEDPADGLKAFPAMPGEALAAELEKAGLKILESVAVDSEKEISARMKVEFRTLAALASMERLESQKKGRKSEAPTEGMTLTRDDRGVYSFCFGVRPNQGGDEDGVEMEEEEEEAAAETEAPEAPPAGGETKAPADPESEMKRMKEEAALAGELVGQLMGEMSKLKVVVGVTVPGEVVDHSPKAGARVEGGKVTWTLDFGTMMQMGMESGMGSEDAGRMKVLFRMPEGKSIPESALTPAAKAAEPEAKPAPAGPAGPPAGGE